MSKKKRKASNFVEVNLSTPWVIDGQHRLMSYQTNSVSAFDDSTALKFVSERSKVHREYIREVEKTKRHGYSLSAVLLLIAVVVPIFAPEGREVISYITSGGLTLFAAGVFGYSKIKLSTLKQKVVMAKQ